MAKAGHLLSARNIFPIPSPHPVGQAKSFKVLSQAPKNGASDPRKQNPQPLIRKKGYKAPRRLISISTSHGTWQSEWTTDHVCSLRDLQLDDLVKDDQKNEVLITLSIQEHAAYGFSVDGKIVTSLTRTCSNCFSPYCKEIDTGFHVWILPSPTIKHDDQLPEIGGDDPSLKVIYVKPGQEADLDSVVQETIRLAISVQDTCSDSCEKSESELVYFGQEHTDSAEKRWPKLSELKKRIQNSTP